MALDIPHPPETSDARPRGEEAQRALQAAIGLLFSETNFDSTHRDRIGELFELLWDIVKRDPTF